MKLIIILSLVNIQSVTARSLGSKAFSSSFAVEKWSNKSGPLERDLISLSIAFGNTIDFFGDRKDPNRFSQQLLQNVVDRSGSPTILRIGGNTQDRAIYCEDCDDTIHSVENPDPEDPKKSEAIYITFNGNLYHVLNENVPHGTPIILGLNYRNGKFPIVLCQKDDAYSEKVVSKFPKMKSAVLSKFWTKTTSWHNAALPCNGNPYAANFALYDGDKLRKLVFINLGKYGKAQAIPREFQIHDVSHTLGKAISVRRLTGELSTSTTGVTWAGQEIDYSGKVVGQVNHENVYDGLVKVYNSDVVVIEII